MRIGIDARLYYYRQAGIGNYVVRLIRALAEIDAEDRFTVFQSWKDKTSLAEWPNFYRYPLLTPCHNRFEQLTLPLELAFNNLDLLHSPDFIPPFRRGCKSVITVHDLAFLIFPAFLTKESRRYYGQIQRAIESADGIIADSESTREDMVRLLGVPRERVDVIYLAPDEIFRPLDLSTESITDFQHRFNLDSPYILYVGTIEPRKNLAILLQAFSKLFAGAGDTVKAGERHPWRVKGLEKLPKLVLVGKKGWLYEDIYKLVNALGLEEQVQFVEDYNLEDLVLFYNMADLFVYPSLYEGFGFPPLEAMACGTPVISSRTSSLVEIVGDGGVMVEPEDIDGLAEGMFHVLSNPSYQSELIKRGFQQAAQFSWRKAAEETLAIYRRVGN